MKHQYHVYASAKEGVPNADLISQMHTFLQLHVSDGEAEEYSIYELTDKGSFPDLPDFQIIVNYPTEEALRDGFKAVKNTYKQAPHEPLMRMVKVMKVAFSKEHEY